MTRRKLITLLGGLIAAPVAHPFVARADKTRRIGLLINLRSDDPEGQNRLTAFVQALQKFGWTEGSNVHIDLRWASDDADLSRRYAEELVALAPDVLLASGTQAVVALQKVTRSVPIVFVNATDPVGGGIVRSVARPGGNTTGFVAFEYSISGKWLELLRKLAPQTTRVAVLRDPALVSNIGLFAAIQSAASFSSGVELSVIDLHDVNEIERGLAVFGHEPNGAVITLANPLQNEERCFGTRRLGNLTDRRSGGESGYVLCRRSDAHGRGRRCGWGGPLLRGDEPKGRKAEDHQRGDDNDDKSHLQALKRCAKFTQTFFLH